MPAKVSSSPTHGRGCFATRNFTAGRVVARCPLLTFTPKESAALYKTKLGAYLFHLKDGPANAAADHTAMAVGPFSFLNHSDDPNGECEIDEESSMLTVTALRDIKKNEEITIDYGEGAEELIAYAV